MLPLIVILAILMLRLSYISTPEQIKRLTTKITKKQKGITINTSALAILLDKGYSEQLIHLYCKPLADILQSYKLKHNDDIYNHRIEFIEAFEKIRDKEAENKAREEEEKAQNAKLIKIAKILALPALVVLAIHSCSLKEKNEEENIRDNNRNAAEQYGMAVRLAFEQAAKDGDDASTVADLSDGHGKVYLSPDLNYQGLKFYTSDIEGFESYAFLDSNNMCGEYFYRYKSDLFDTVKKYKLNDGCYKDKYFYRVKPVYSDEELRDKAIIKLQEEVNRLRSEIDSLKPNNR